jgi:hypothetical protein
MQTLSAIVRLTLSTNANVIQCAIVRPIHRGNITPCSITCILQVLHFFSELCVLYIIVHRAAMCFSMHAKGHLLCKTSMLRPLPLFLALWAIINEVGHSSNDMRLHNYDNTIIHTHVSHVGFGNNPKSGRDFGSTLSTLVPPWHSGDCCLQRMMEHTEETCA